MYKLKIPKKINVENFFIKKNLNWLVDLSKQNRPIITSHFNYLNGNMNSKKNIS